MAQKISNLPIGAKIKFGKHQINTESAWPIVWVIADKNHEGYPSDSVSLITQKIIDLRAFDAKENWNGTGTSGQYGYSNYAVSNINQWLNSDAGAGKWYSAQHTYDAPPTSSTTSNSTEYQSRPGFLNNFTAAERSALLPTTLLLTLANNVSVSVVSKVFLPSFWEITGTHSYPENASKLAYFTTHGAGASVTGQVISNSLASTRPSSDLEYYDYMTRSVIGDYVGYITKTGTNGTINAFNGEKGIRPCINLSSSLKISDTVDSDGCYTVISQNVPVISESNSNLGEKKTGFTQTYSVSDADGDPVTVTEYIDNVKIRSYVATLGATNPFAVTGATWLKLANGAHTLKITATDGFDTATRTITFTKSVSTIVVERSEPITSATQPTRIIVSIVKNIPAEATLSVQVCNNGFDTDPAWETIAPNTLYEFSNTKKEAGKDWGVNIRVTVNRNGDQGACYITEIGGNFD